MPKRNLPQVVSDPIVQPVLLPELDPNQSPFEQIKHTENGIEFWYAHELATVLEYSQWQYFKPAIERAKVACATAGYAVNDHFMLDHEPIVSGKGGTQKVSGYKLSRLACDFIAMNGDPSKEIIALAQTYFITQTRRQELADQKRAQQQIDRRNQNVTGYQLHGHDRDWSENRVDGKVSTKAALLSQKAIDGAAKKCVKIIIYEVQS